VGTFKDLSGKRFGRLVVVERAESAKTGVHWLCKCDCGNTSIVVGANLQRGHTKSCGCGAPQQKDLTGQVFGRLTVIGLAIPKPFKTNQSAWNCRCACGNMKPVRAQSLIGGGAKSCGCFANENRKSIGFKHYLCNTPTYNSWLSMKQRCLNPNATGYDLYGGRGIKICERWLKFENFVADMGVRPDGRTLDRIDNNGNYEPGNCRWSTSHEQNRNRSKLHMITWNGKTQCIEDWSREIGLSVGCIAHRLKTGMSMDEIAAKPSQRAKS
jgi:hypothetical protein